MWTLTTQKCMWVDAFSCMLQDGPVCAASPLTSQPCSTPALTVLIPHQCTQPVVATVDQHFCSPTLTPSGRRQASPASTTVTDSAAHSPYWNLNIADSIFTKTPYFLQCMIKQNKLFFLFLFTVLNKPLNLLICMQNHFMFVPTCCMLLCIRKWEKSTFSV